MSEGLTRRSLIAGGAAALGAMSMTAAQAQRVVGANDRIRAAFIGVGNRGGQLLSAALPNEDLDIVCVCDAYRPFMREARTKVGGACEMEADFRKILERDDIDCVFIATPDHWHAAQTVMACDAGKDVYVEKPLSVTIREGQRMIAAARRNNAVVQVGIQRRASSLMPKLISAIHDGTFGKIVFSRSYRITNMCPEGIGISEETEAPDGLDWDMWLGPRPFRPYRTNIHPYKFRWWREFSSQLANWGVHSFDLIRWLIGEEAPTAVSAHGGVYAVNDSRDIPDTMLATYEFASGRLMEFGQFETMSNGMNKGLVELRGTLATLNVDAGYYEILPEKAGQFGAPAPLPEAGTVKDENAVRDYTVPHIRNFLDCVKSRETPFCDVEVGHRSTVFAHLGNIALETKSRIEWDPQTERITNNRKANDLLHYEYRAPWVLG